MKRHLLLTIFAACSIGIAAANTITVNSTADVAGNDGQCTLREAINSANTNTVSGAMAGECGAGAAGLDTISFAISGAGVKTITPTSTLPAITDPVIIDGYTQPGASANTLALGNDAVLLIELNGNGTISQALTISAGASTIRGLVMNRFDGNGITLQTAGGNTLEGNWFGVSASGTTRLNNNGRDIFVSNSLNNLIGGTSPAARNVLTGSSGNGALALFTGGFATVQGNYIGMNAQGTDGLASPGGIGIGTSGNLIGGTAPGAGNVISGSRSLSIGDGIAASKNNIVQGNTFGLAADGTTALTNNTGSVVINITPSNLADGNLIGGTAPGARNVFATSITAIVISGVVAGVGGNTIQGNFIGLNVTGTATPVPRDSSSRRGVLISDSNNHVIGGTAPGAGNVIASYSSGVEIYGSGNVVQGNFIGTNAAGTAALGNGTGILLSNNNLTGNNNIIGGSAPGAGNLISGNTDGIRMIPGSANLVQGNLIGTDVNGTANLGNAGYGVFMSTGASNNTIGGTIAGEGNVIAFNGSASRNSGGVGVQSGTGNSIRGNAIFSNTGNTGLGINHFGGAETIGVTSNDSCDADTGPNNLQNYPVIESVTNTAGSVNITGSLNSTANTTYRLEFFRNDAVDPSGFGEGQVFLGSMDVLTDGSCNATFNVNFPSAVRARGVTATATDPSGNTSEFSATIGQLLNISTRLRVETGDNVLIGGFIITGSDPKRVMIRGIGPSLSGSIQGFLADPTLELHDAASTLATNDDWKLRSDGSSQQAEIEATTIPPTNDLESALVRTLPANNAGYTAIVRGKDNTTGIGVVEAYDLDTAANSKLANISTRGLVETGNNVLIGGFIPGNGVTKVIIRAIGPTLVNAGVPDPLQDPTLQLVNASGTVLATNDDWKTNPDGSSQQAEIEATGIPPNDNRESALVASLIPGNYTAVVRGKNDTIGIAVVEVYALQ